MRKVLKFLGTALIGGVLIIVGLAILEAIFVPSHPTAASLPAQTQQTEQPGGNEANSQPAQNAAASTQITLPASEQQFLAIISSATAAYNQAANDMQKGAVRNQRATSICNQFPTRHVTDWIGTITTLDSTDKGNGVLTLQIAQGVTAGTLNNQFSDALGTPTLIPVGSALFQKVSAMKVGDIVRFSGTFNESDTDCFELTDLTGDGSMQSPDFIIHFTNVDEAGIPN